MKPTILAVRSIGAEFANRTYNIVVGVIATILLLLLGITTWLTTLSDWWWLLLALLIIATCVAVGVFIIVKLVIRSVTPLQSSTQKARTEALVDKLQQLSETAQTPKFILLFRLVRDIAAPRQNGFIATLSNDTISLKHDFIALSRTFK